MRKFFNIIIAFAPLFLVGCETNSSESTTSSVAQLTSFYFAKNDSMPGLSTTFTIEELLDTGLVWNKDSMLFGTSLEKAVPKFVFAATPSRVVLETPDTTCSLTGYDTLDFSKRPIYLTIESSDRSTTKVYEIRPTVHQVDPDLFTWTKLTDAIYPEDDSEQRALELDDQFVMISSNGFALHTYASPDGATWLDLGSPTGLPAGTRVRQIISDNTMLYYGQGNAIYYSSDGINWLSEAVDYPVITMLLYWNERVWALVDNGKGYELAYVNEEGKLSLSGLQPTDNFPISDFGAVCFQNASERARAMIIGGFAENGQSLNTRWNLEYSTHPLPNGTYRLEEFSIDRPKFTSLTGISVVWYNKQLMLFGGVDDKQTYFGRDIYVSDNEGISWYAADSTKNQLPMEYSERQKQNAIVRDNYIYLFGGEDAIQTYSDVYRGRLNSIDW